MCKKSKWVNNEREKTRCAGKTLQDAKKLILEMLNFFDGAIHYLQEQTQKNVQL